MGKNVRVTKESETGRNLKFRDDKRHESMTRARFVEKIEQGRYTGYHVRKVGGIKTPVSNPDKSETNNLG